MSNTVRFKVEIRKCKSDDHRWVEIHVAGHGPFCTRAFYSQFDLPRDTEDVEMVFSYDKPRDVDAIPCYLIGVTPDISGHRPSEYPVAYLNPNGYLTGSCWERGKSDELDAFFDRLWDGPYWVWLEYSPAPTRRAR